MFYHNWPVTVQKSLRWLSPDYHGLSLVVPIVQKIRAIFAFLWSRIIHLFLSDLLQLFSLVAMASGSIFYTLKKLSTSLCGQYFHPFYLFILIFLSTSLFVCLFVSVKTRCHPLQSIFHSHSDSLVKHK